MSRIAVSVKEMLSGDGLDRRVEEMPKKICSRVALASSATAFTLVITVRPAYAYIDLGSGSYIIQMLFASVFGSLFAFKVLWRRLAAQTNRLFVWIRS